MPFDSPDPKDSTSNARLVGKNKKYHMPPHSKALCALRAGLIIKTMSMIEANKEWERRKWKQILLQVFLLLPAEISDIGWSLLKLLEEGGNIFP